uniref:Metalloid reductase RarA n=1 Tax=Sulfurospirillum barnesii TaxID=44674 RepID=Q8GNE7_9BACT|nr:metalloid reductase RarA [Sulfurospirillum barnesii SES-3]
MKLAKLSLAAMIVAGLASSSFAADTLADAFKNGKVSGEIKAWYFDKTVENTDAAKDKENNANIANFGLTLGFVTDSLYGFYAGATFQGSATPFIDNDAEGKNTAKDGKADTANFGTTNAASGAVLSEAYLGYKLGKTDVKVGRQFISTPLVNGSGSRFFKESFEGAVLVNTDLPQTTVFAGYAGKFQGRTSAVSGDGLGDAPSFHKKAVYAGLKNALTGKSATDYTSRDGGYTAGAINKSISNLTLTGQYLFVDNAHDTDGVDVYYTEANYVLPMSGFKLGFDATFRGSHTRDDLDALNASGHMFSGRVSLSGLAGFGASFAAATTSSDHVLLGAGNGPTTYTATMIAGAATPTAAANTDSYLFQVTYDFSKVGVAGLTAVAQYGWTEQGTQPKLDLETGNSSKVKGTDRTTYAAGVTYAVPALKGLTTSLQYEVQEADSKTAGTKTVDTDEMWFKASYKF